MAIPGQKTGADAISKDVNHICGLVQSYGPKLALLITAAQSAGVIDSTEAAALNAFIAAANAACVIWQKLASYNSVGS